MHDTPPLMDFDYQEIFDRSPLSCAVLSPDLLILTCNQAYEKNANRSRKDMLSRCIFDAFPSQGSSREALQLSFAYVRENRQAHQIPLLHYPISVENVGEEELLSRYWTVSNIPLLDENGALRFILHHPTDITELAQLRQTNEEHLPAIVPASESAAIASTNLWARDVQEILHVERERLQQLFQQAPGFICILRGPQHIYELANDAYYQLIGHRQILGCVLAEVLPEVIDQGYLDKLDRAFATGEPFIGRAFPIQLQRVVGGPLEQRYIDIVYQPIRDSAAEVSGIFVQGHDVTEAHELAQEISYQAAHDSLTGLYNRREFARQSRQLEKLTGPHALLYMDLDHFKIINDRAGHAAGDALLLQVATVLLQHVRKSDVLARLGGDEFALILPGCSEDDALELAHALRCKIRDIPFVWSKRRYSVSLASAL
ncbi:diguanylate cyclase domain-containing protein [Allopusillimonas ginsengisoli]|uniref:sensor domain-containing diguanylate cyclase n=1 Tax=Allopusillimonas ginsengisoli TaxID=453575 RepID=UPI0039C3B07B